MLPGLQLLKLSERSQQWFLPTRWVNPYVYGLTYCASQKRPQNRRLYCQCWSRLLHRWTAIETENPISSLWIQDSAFAFLGLLIYCEHPSGSSAVTERCSDEFWIDWARQNFARWDYVKETKFLKYSPTFAALLTGFTTFVTVRRQWSTEAGFCRLGRIRSFGQSLTRSFGRITKLRLFTDASAIYRGFGVLPKLRPLTGANYFK